MFIENEKVTQFTDYNREMGPKTIAWLRKYNITEKSFRNIRKTSVYGRQGEKS